MLFGSFSIQISLPTVLYFALVVWTHVSLRLFELAVLLRIFFQRFFFVLGFLTPLSFLLFKEEKHQKRKSDYIESHDLFRSLPWWIRIF